MSKTSSCSDVKLSEAWNSMAALNFSFSIFTYERNTDMPGRHTYDIENNSAPLITFEVQKQLTQFPGKIFHLFSVARRAAMKSLSNSCRMAGTAGIWTQGLLFTRQVLWPAKPQHLLCCTWNASAGSWEDKERGLSSITWSFSHVQREERRLLNWIKLRVLLMYHKGTAGIWTQDLLFTRQAL